MPRALAAGKKKIAIMASKPTAANDAAMEALAASVFTGSGVIDAACRIAQDGYKLGAKEDKTVTDSAVCEAVESEVPTFSQYEGSVTVFRYFDETGKAETGVAGEIGDAVFQAMKKRGTTLWIAQRETSKKSTDAWGAGDEYDLYEVITGTPQQVDGDGYIKRTITLYVQRAWSGVVAS